MQTSQSLESSNSLCVAEQIVSIVLSVGINTIGLYTGQTQGLIISDIK